MAQRTSDSRRWLRWHQELRKQDEQQIRAESALHRARKRRRLAQTEAARTKAATEVVDSSDLLHNLRLHKAELESQVKMMEEQDVCDSGASPFMLFADRARYLQEMSEKATRAPTNLFVDSDESEDDTDTHRRQQPKRRRCEGSQPRGRREDAPQPTPHTFTHAVPATEGLNHDWTKHMDRQIERELQSARNNMRKHKSRSAKPDTSRSGGDSLASLIKSGEVCKYHSVRAVGDVGVGDIVFCWVKPTCQNGVHAIMSKTYDDEFEAWYFTVDNGWCWMDDIYGKLERISRDHVLKPLRAAMPNRPDRPTCLVHR